MREVGQALGVVERPTDGTTRSGRFRRRAPDHARRRRLLVHALVRHRHHHRCRGAGPRPPRRGVAAPVAPPAEPTRTNGRTSPQERRADAAAARSRAVLVPAESRTKRRGARPLVLGAVLIAAIAGAGIAGWTVGGADTETKPDPGAVAAQRSAAAKARTAAAQERERVAWLGSANDSIARLDARRASLPAQPRTGEDARGPGRGRPPAGLVLRARAGPGGARPGQRGRCRRPRRRPSPRGERLHAAGHRREQRQPLGLPPRRRLGARGRGRGGRPP